MESIFGIGIAELIFIAIIALVVLGPERLPGAIRSVASVFRQVRNLSSELTSQFSEEFKALDEINPKNLLKEIGDDLMGEDDNKNAKGVAAKTGSAKAGSAAAATKSTTRPAATTKPAAAATAPKSPTTPAKQVTTARPRSSDKAAEGDASTVAAGSNEKAPADKTTIDQTAAEEAAADKAAADKAAAVDVENAGEVAGAEETAPGDSTGQLAAPATTSVAASSEPVAAEQPAAVDEPSEPKQRSALPGGIGTKNASASFAPGSIPKHMGIPATSRKQDPVPASDSGSDANSDSSSDSDAMTAPQEQTRDPGAKLVGKKAQAQAGEDVARENSILPPQAAASGDEQSATADDVQFPQKPMSDKRMSHKPTAENSSAEDEADRPGETRGEKNSAASAATPSSASRPSVAKSPTVSVNGKSGDS